MPIYSYAQQNAHFNSISNPRCPTKAFFARSVQLYQCIFRDMRKNNPDVGWKLYYETSTLESITLKEAIQGKHGLNGPDTFRRNNTKTQSVAYGFHQIL